MKISIETILRANAMGIARSKMGKNPFYKKMMQYSHVENPSILELTKDRDKLHSAFKKAWDSVVGKNNKKS